MKQFQSIQLEHTHTPYIICSLRTFIKWPHAAYPQELVFPMEVGTARAQGLWGR